jgi:hypothetical protein
MDIKTRTATATAILHIVFMVSLLLVSAVFSAGFFEFRETHRLGPLGWHELELGIVHGWGKVPVIQERGDGELFGGSRFGDDILAREWLLAFGNPDLEIDVRAAEEQMIAPDAAYDRLADHHRQGQILDHQRKGIAVDQIGGREQNAGRFAAKVITFSTVSGTFSVADLLIGFAPSWSCRHRRISGSSIRLCAARILFGRLTVVVADMS